QHINRLFGFIVPLLSNFRSISLDCYSDFDYDFSKTVNGSIYAYDYFKTIEIVDGKEFTLNIKPFWHFDNGEALDYSIESDNVSVNRDDSGCNITFKAAGNYIVNVKPVAGTIPYDAPVVQLYFKAVEKKTPAPAKLVIESVTSIKDFEVSEATNTFKYIGPELQFGKDGTCPVSFDKFWQFTVDDEVVEDNAPIDDGKVSLTLEKNGNENVIKVEIRTSKVYNDEKDDVLTLVFDVADYVAPFDLEFAKDQDKFTIETKDDKTTATYKDTVKIINDASTTVLFNKFWEFTGEGVTEKHEGIEEAQATDSDIGTKYDYKVVFGKESEEGIHTFIVSASQGEGPDAKELSFDINFNVEKVYTAKLSEIANDSIPSNFKRSDDDNTFICTDELLLEDGSVQASVSQFWGFIINGEEAAPTGNYYTCDGEEVDVGANGFIFNSEGTHTVKVYADKDHTGEGNDFVTLIFEVTKPEPEITVDPTTGEFTEADDKFTFAGDFEETEDDEGNCKFTAAFKPFWNFKLGEDAVAYEIYTEDDSVQTVEKDDENETLAIDFTESGKHTYTVKAVDDEGTPYENAPSVTLVFDVPEHEELPTVEYDEDVWSKYFTRSKDDDNTFIYNDKLEFTAGSSCTARFKPFYSFKLNSLAEGKHLFSSLKITNFECANEPDDILALTFDEEGDYNVVVTSALYNEVVGEDSEKTYEHIKDYDMPAVTLKFHVTKRTPVIPDPVFPVDPVTPAPTATPTATPAPTETPAPTDAPTDAPTSAPTAAPDVEMQVSAGGKRLNVRSGAGIGNSIIARLNDGSKVTVLLVEGDWSYIRATVNGNVIEGYVSSQYLKEISTAEPTEPTNARVSTSGSALRLRSRASLNASIIARMPNGSSLKVLETVNGWCRVQFTAANGTVHEGWASSQYITVIA
ncbi:MAG: SH3 domain-containing protein, partial [Candidatus Fimadaptatus sp.]|nr:SH3 domain-containing protein [Candidatus Fimadaptatus sp.]